MSLDVMKSFLCSTCYAHSRWYVEQQLGCRWCDDATIYKQNPVREKIRWLTMIRIDFSQMKLWIQWINQMQFWIDILHNDFEFELSFQKRVAQLPFFAQGISNRIIISTKQENRENVKCKMGTENILRWMQKLILMNMILPIAV